MVKIVKINLPTESDEDESSESETLTVESLTETTHPCSSKNVYGYIRVKKNVPAAPLAAPPPTNDGAERSSRDQRERPKSSTSGLSIKTQSSQRSFISTFSFFFPRSKTFIKN